MKSDLWREKFTLSVSQGSISRDHTETQKQVSKGPILRSLGPSRSTGLSRTIQTWRKNGRPRVRCFRGHKVYLPTHKVIHYIGGTHLNNTIDLFQSINQVTVRFSYISPVSSVKSPRNREILAYAEPHELEKTCHSFYSSAARVMLSISRTHAAREERGCHL